MPSNIHAMCSSNCCSLDGNKALHNISMQIRAGLSCRGLQNPHQQQPTFAQCLAPVRLLLDYCCNVQAVLQLAGYKSAQ